MLEAARAEMVDGTYNALASVEHNRRVVMAPRYPDIADGIVVQVWPRMRSALPSAGQNRPTDGCIQIK